jgi:hypothetical protein
VSPSSDIQELINAKPPRTTFCFAAGTYNLSGTIWTGDRFPILDLRAGAVIDGQNGDFAGVNGPDGPANEPGTIILGGVFQHFGNDGAPAWITAVIVRRNGVVNGTEFRENFNTGLGIVGDNARVANVNTHHNGRYGLGVTHPCVGCPAPGGVIIESSEIAFNNTRKLPVDDDAGGTKFSAGTDGMIVRGNVVHHNYGSGLWWDGFNKNAQVYNNVIHDNRNWGIFWELSYGGTKIHHNTLTGNGVGDGTVNFFSNVQLLVSCSDGSVGGIEIYENTIDGVAYPLAIIDHNAHPIRTRNVYVHDNAITLRSLSGRVGAFDATDTGGLFSATANNRFERNTYRVPIAGAAYWAWEGQTFTWSQWLAEGQDANGSVQATV